MTKEKKFIGQVITSATFDGDSAITLMFGDKGIVISDEGQSCCEHRYMDVQDDISYLIGKTYLGWELGEYTNDDDDEWYVHDIQFLNINVSDYTLQVSNHNEHNGYYSGFYIVEREI